MISVIQVSSGTERTLSRGFSPANISVSSDGSTILFSDGAAEGTELFTIGINGGNPRQISHETDGIASAVISGDGRSAFAVTGGSRLIRVDTISGGATELIATTPRVDASYRLYPPATTIAALGSVIELYGFAVPAIQKLTLCGRPLAFVQPHARFQIPWDLQEGTCQAIVSAASEFEDAAVLQVQTYDPRFIANGMLFHAGFSGTVTANSPAHPGEVISAYMTGLGPMDSRGGLTSGFRCSVGPMTADVLYAGVAPGATGFYQINVRIPNVTSSFASLNCGFDRVRQTSANVWLGPTQ
jgi:hypothetical protein